MKKYRFYLPKTIKDITGEILSDDSGVIKIRDIKGKVHYFKNFDNISEIESFKITEKTKPINYEENPPF